LLYRLHALCRKDSSRNIAFAALRAKSAKMKVRASPYTYLSAAQQSDLGEFERYPGSIAPYSCKLLYIACSNHHLCQDRSKRNLNTRSYAHRAEKSRKFRGAIVPYCCAGAPCSWNSTTASCSLDTWGVAFSDLEKYSDLNIIVRTCQGLQAEDSAGVWIGCTSGVLADSFGFFSSCVTSSRCTTVPSLLHFLRIKVLQPN
jgi:hypothetical protein